MSRGAARGPEAGRVTDPFALEGGGSLAWDPDPSSDRGPTLSIRQTLGAQAATFSEEVLVLLLSGANAAQRSALCGSLRAVRAGPPCVRAAAPSRGRG